MASATFWGVGRGPGYFKAGVSQAPSTPKSAVGGKVVLEMGGGGIKRRGARGEGGIQASCWGEDLGVSSARGNAWGGDGHHKPTELRNSPESREAWWNWEEGDGRSPWPEERAPVPSWGLPTPSPRPALVSAAFPEGRRGGGGR